MELVVDNDQYQERVPFSRKQYYSRFCLIGYDSMHTVKRLPTFGRNKVHPPPKHTHTPPHTHTPSPYAFRQVSWKIKDQIKLLNLKKTSNYNIIFSSCQLTVHGFMFGDSQDPPGSFLLCSSGCLYKQHTSHYSISRYFARNLIITYGERHRLWNSRQVKRLTYRWLLYFC